MADVPSVLFVCVKNGGKSQMAAGLMRSLVADRVDIDSAGTQPGSRLNELSVSVLAEVGVDISGQSPKRLTDDLVRRVDRVVVLGRDAHIEPVGDTLIDYWDTDEPSERGIAGLDRMRLVRDDIARRVRQLSLVLNGDATAS